MKIANVFCFLVLFMGVRAGLAQEHFLHELPVIVPDSEWDPLREQLVSALSREMRDFSTVATLRNFIALPRIITRRGGPPGNGRKGEE